MRVSIIVRDLAAVDICAFHKRSELYCGLFIDCLSVCFSLFLYFVVRVRCCKKLTFAISSADEFLVSATSVMAIFAEIAENECIMRRRSHVSC